ncbi:hypothetical protein ACYTX7_09910, partial [Streptococcus pyogenes]
PHPPCLERQRDFTRISGKDADPMTTGFITALLAGAFAGGFINGLTGFGTALLSLGFWLQIMPPPQAVAIVVVMSVVSGLQGL